jgi:hypothetical protein
MIKAWVLDREDDSASLPEWLTAAVQERTEDGLLVLASRAGTVEAGPGDLVMWDGLRIRVYSGHRIAALCVEPALKQSPVPALQQTKPLPRGLGLPFVFAIIAFLVLLAFGYAWLMIKLIGRSGLHY